MPEIICQIAGSTFHKQAPLIIGRLRHLQRLRLKRDPKNIHDPNAIGVYHVENRDGKLVGTQLGYLPRGVAEQLAPLMDGGMPEPEIVRWSVRHDRTGASIYGQVRITYGDGTEDQSGPGPDPCA
jgi:hypothetical protein